MSYVLIYILINLGIVIGAYGVFCWSQEKGVARWQPLMVRMAIGLGLVGIAQCIRLLIEINGKFPHPLL